MPSAASSGRRKRHSRTRATRLSSSCSVISVAVAGPDLAENLHALNPERPLDFCLDREVDGISERLPELVAVRREGRVEYGHYDGGGNIVLHVTSLSSSGPGGGAAAWA